MPVFLGISTYRRPAYLAQVLAGVEAHLNPDWLMVVHDGPTEEWPGGRQRFMSCLPEREGVAAVKNALLRRALDTNADWIILAEDDIVPHSPKAITGYIAAAEGSGIHHLAFHAHGPANVGGPVGTDETGLVTMWPNYVGAWCLYSRQAIETVGFFDEDLYLALEHVEHSVRMAEAGFCPLPQWEGDRRVADATGSEEWLSEIPGSIENSSILSDGGEMAQRERFRRARATWKAKDPASYARVFMS